VRRAPERRDRPRSHHSPDLATVIGNHPKLFLSSTPSVRTIQLMFYTHQFDAAHKLVGAYPGVSADKRVRVNKRLVWKSRRDEVIKAWEIGLKDAR